MTRHPLRLHARSSLTVLASCLALAASTAACETPARRPIGSACDTDAECVTGLCASDQCVEPAADADSDGLTNGLEAQLGSNAFAADSDDDGIVDGLEIDAQRANVDTDGDGKADVIESATADADGDCITDQYDAEDATPNTDLSPMIPVVCHGNGVCAGQEGKFRASCEGGVAVCVYTDIQGYVNPEITCNAVDENCDGLPDDGFPDRDDDAIADCVDSDWDNDGVADGTDVCPTVADPDQIDTDADGVGDLCGQLYALVFTRAPSVATAGKAFEATVAIAPGAASEVPVDAPLPPFHGTVVVTLDAAGGVATLSGTTQVAALGGVASFGGLVISPSGPGMALIATSGALAPGRSATFDVEAGTLDHFIVEDAPLTRAAGDAFAFDVLAVDANGTLVDTYAGTAAITSSDAAATLPASVTFVAGRAQVSVTLGTVGTQTVTVTASQDSAIAATFSVDVTFGAVAALDVTSSASPVVAGVAPTLTIRATDAYDNTVTSYTGVVAVATDDPAVSGTVQVIFAAGAGGGVATTDQLALETAGLRRVTATDMAEASVTGSLTLTCVHASLDHFTVTGPPATVAGAPFDVTVTARDAFGNAMSSDFVGTVALTASDAGAQLPDAYDITANDEGTHTFVGVTLLAAGMQTVTATDPASGAAGSLTLDVTAASDLVLRVISVPADVTAGVPFAMTVAVQDSFGNPPVAFGGTLLLTSNDAQFVPPAPVVIGPADLGQATFSGIVLKTAGTRRITVSERAHALAVGTNLNVAPAGAVRLGASGPDAVVAGVPFAVTVTAYDAFDNVASGYGGTVVVGSSDPRMRPPTPVTFGAPDAGVRAIDALVLETAGDQTLTIGDGALTIQLATRVAPAAAASLAVTQLPGSVVAGVAAGFKVRAFDAFGNVATGYTGTVAFTTSDAQVTSPPASHAFVSADAGVFEVSGLVLYTAGDQSVVATDTLSTSLVASANTRVDPAAASRFSLVGTDASVPAGVETSVLVTARDPFGNVATGYIGAVAFASATDVQATMPANLLFAAEDRGEKLAGQLTFRTVGTQALTATDVADAGRAGATTFEVLEGASKLYVLRNVPARTVAGEAFALSLEVTDTFGNRISDYTGTVAFTATDGSADLPTEYTFSEAETGIHLFEGFVLKTAGNQTLRATDTSDDAITASALIGVDPGTAATVELTGLGASVAAGAAQTLTLSVRDAHGNIATGFAGSIALASSDPSATLPASVAMSGLGGQSTFTATLRTAGAQSLTAYLSSPTAEMTANTTVAPAAADHLTVSPASSSGPAGRAFTLTVTARDPFDNVATGYAGTVSFDAAQSAGETVPATARFSVVDLGVKTFTNGFNLRVAGVRTITVSGSGLTTPTASAQRTVTPLALHHFALETATTTTTAGSAFSVKATALDTYGNIVTGHTGVAHFAVDSGGATLPVDYTFLASDAGAHTFTNGVTLTQSGARTVTVSDVATPSATGSVSVTITPASTHHFALTPTPDTRRAGDTFALTATALDTYGNTVTGYGGSVHFAVDSGNATLPPNTPFVAGAAGDNGQKAFSGFALERVGTRTVTINDVAAPGITGTASITITPATIHHLTVATSPAGASTAGQAFTVSVTANDTYGNTIPTYVGTVSFAAGAGGPNEILPAAYTFAPGDSGTRDFSSGVTLTKSGARTITVTDTAGITGSASRTINPAATHHLAFEVPSATVTAGDTLSFKVTAQDLYNNTTPAYAGTVQLSDNVPGNDIPAAHTYLLAENGVYTFTNAKLKVAGAHTITATDVGSPAITGTATRTVNPGPLHHLKFTPASASVTANQVFTLRLSARDANDNVVPSYAAPKKVTFTNTGGGLAGLPTEYAFSVADAGEHDFAGLSYTTTGTWQITARDFDTPTVLATADITVGNSGLASFTVTKVAPASPPPAPHFAYAGQSFQVTVTARDTGGNPLTSYAGVVHLALDAGSGTIPADYTFKPGAAGDNGQHTFTIAANLSNAQSPGVGTTRTITVNDTLTPSVTGTVTADIAPSPANHLQLATSVATSVKAGTAFTVTARALDAYDNTDTFYRGTVALTATSAGAGLASATYTAGDAGLHTWTGVSLDRVGTQTITGTSTGASPITGNVAVAIIHGDPTKLVFESLPAGAPVANVAFSAKVTAYDAKDNIATGYRGTVSFASTVIYTAAPYSESVPAATAFTAVDNGSHTFSFTLQKAAVRALVATDAATGLTQASASVTITYGALAKFVWNPAPAATTAGVAFTPTLEARDAWDNVVKNYTGTVNLTLDASAGTNGVNGNKWPTTGTFVAADNGVHLFTGSTNNFTLTKSGTRRITATQTGAGGQPTGYVDVTINPATTSQFSVTSPIAATAGTAFSATVTALDPYANQVPSYAGSVSFTLTGAGSTVPGAYTFVPATDAGAHAFTGAFKVTIAPTQTLTVTAATTGYTGSATVNVTAAAHAKFAWSGLPTPNITAGVAFGNAVTLTAQDTYGNTVTTYNGTPSLAFDTPNPAPPQSETCPASTTLASGTKTFTATTFKALAAGSRTVTATAGATTGVGNFTVVAGTADHLLVAPAASGTAGQAFSATVTAQDAYNNKATSYLGQISLTLDGTGSTVSGSPYKFVAADAGAHTFANAFTATVAGTRTLSTVDTATPSISGNGTISIGAATPTTIAWGTQPASTAQGSTLATVTVQLKDTYGNVCTNFSSATNAVSLKIGRNPSQGRLMTGSTTTAYPSSGVASFSNLKIDRAGTGYTLVASYTTFATATSSQFNITYAAPSFVGTPTLTWPSGTSKRGCPTITYTLKHPSSEPAKVTGRWTTTSTKDATPLGTSLGSDGSFGVTTNTTGIAHTYTWDSPADFGQTAYAGLKLRLEAKVGDVAAAATADFTFDLDNNWSGTWTPTAITSAIAPRLTAAADLDRDGFGDLVVPGGGSFVVQFFNPATQALANEQSVAVSGATDLYAAAIGDIDKDGDLDIVVADRTSGVVTLKRVKTVAAHSLTFETDVTMTPCSFITGDTVPRVSDVAIGDFDRNGQNDFAIACTNKKIVEVHTYVAGTPGTTSQLSISPVSGMSSYKPVALAVAEIDGDGYADLVVGHDLGVSYTYRGGAAAVILTVKATHRDFTAVKDVAVGDLDHDGYLDVALANTQSYAGIYWGTAGAISGTSPTTRNVTISGTSYVVESVDIADVDVDGRADLVLGSIATDNAFLMRSTSFRTSTSTTTDGSQQLSRVATPSSGGSQQATLGPARVIVADMNRDGQPDIALARGSATTQTAGVILSKWALAAGACTPTFDAPALPSEQLTPIEGAFAADLNRDAKPDLIHFSNSSTMGEGISLSYGRGDGRFEALGHFLATDSNGNTADDPSIAVTGDFDGDTDLDVATLLESTGGADGRVLVFYQVDEYDFTGGAQVAGTATAQKSLVAGDIDLDGDSDLAMLSLSASTWTIKAYAASAQSFALFASGTITLPAGSTAQQMDMADLNADGILDFVFKRSGTTADLCTVVSTSTSAPFWSTSINTTTQCFSTGRSSFSFMKLADITGDGKLDVVATTLDGQQLYRIDVYDFQTGDTGKINSQLDTSNICAGFSSLAGLELADINQDGRLDAIARCGFSLAAGTIYIPFIYPQQTSGTRFLAATYSNLGDYAASTLSHTTAGHFGGPDVGLLYRGQTFHFDPGGIISDDVAGVTANGSGADLVIAANIDGHADLDLITAARAGDTWWDAKQSANGWTVTSHSPGTGRQIDAIAVGDGNGDGLPDVLVSEQLSSKYNLHWYFNSAGAYSGEAAASITAAGSAIDVARIGIEDTSVTPTVYRQDAFDDFAVGLSNPSSADGLTVFVNLNGSGQPTQVTAAAAMPDVIKHIDAGLLRAADKYRMLAVAGDCGTTTIVPCVKLVGLRYLTSYSLQLSSSLDFSGLSATTLHAMAVGDLNRDGRDDVVTVVGTATSTQIVAFLQGASNTFSRVLVAETTATFPDKLRLADVDRDGYPDLVLHDPTGATSCGAVEILYQNPSTYTTNPPTTVTLRTGHALMASGHCVDDLDVGDVDRSGHTDVITLDAANGLMRAIRQK